MPIHHLSQKDPINQTATCSICGPVETVVSGGTQTCKNRAYATMKAWRDRQPKPPKRERAHRTYTPTAHLLSNINDSAKTATCSQCGPVKIYVFHHRDYTTRRCSYANKQDVVQARNNRRSANRRFINQYKVDIGCQRCSYNENPIGLDLHHRDPGEKEIDMTRVGSYSRERVLVELEKCDVLCAICHRLVHHELEYV